MGDGLLLWSVQLWPTEVERPTVAPLGLSSAADECCVAGGGGCSKSCWSLDFQRRRGGRRLRFWG